MPTTVTRRLGPAALTGLLLSVVLVLAGHVEADTGLSPFDSTISAYAATDRMGSVEFGILLAGLSSLLLPVVMRGTRTPMSRSVTAAVLAWSAGMVVTALVPTTLPEGAELGVAGMVHRWAATLGFVALILAGGLLVRGFGAIPGWTRLRRPLWVLLTMSVTSGLAVAVVTYVGDRRLIGLFERTLGAATLLMLILVAGRLAWPQLVESARRTRNGVATVLRTGTPAPALG